MSELILLRHGKSDWGAGVPDSARPLSRRGRDSARLMGRALTLAGAVPDLVLCSPAVRARSTADLAAEAGGWRSPIVEDEALCPGSPRRLVEAVHRHGGAAHRLLAVGHEPAMSQSAAWLLGGASLHMVTAAAACIELESWEALRPGAGTLLWMLTPKLLPEARPRE